MKFLTDLFKKLLKSPDDSLGLLEAATEAMAIIDAQTTPVQFSPSDVGMVFDKGVVAIIESDTLFIHQLFPGTNLDRVSFDSLWLDRNGFLDYTLPLNNASIHDKYSEAYYELVGEAAAKLESLYNDHINLVYNYDVPADF